MNPEQLQQLSNLIAEQTQILNKNKILFNIYEKINFFEKHFDKDCSLAIKCLSKNKISFIIGEAGRKRTVLDHDQILSIINPCLPNGYSSTSGNIYSNQDIFFKNNPEGYDKFCQAIMGQDYTIFKKDYLEFILPSQESKPKHKI